VIKSKPKTSGADGEGDVNDEEDDEEEDDIADVLGFTGFGTTKVCSFVSLLLSGLYLFKG
jgi:hypothetical protein